MTGWSRRRFLSRAGLAVLAGAGATGGYGSLLELHWIEFTHHEMPIRGLPRALDGTRLAQLSDLHVGRRVDSDYLISVLRRVAELKPEWVVCTGDFVTWHGRESDPLARVLAHTPHGTLGTIAILGNHDYGWAWRDDAVAALVCRRAHDAGFHVLRNDRVTIAGLTFAGVDDAWGPHCDLAATLRGVDPEAPTLALCHNPDVCDYRDWGGYRGWILSGHTHGGQIKPPFLPPPVLPIRNHRYAAGEVALSGGRRLYVSRGIGHLWPIRINVRPELPVFTLRTA